MKLHRRLIAAAATALLAASFLVTAAPAQAATCTPNLRGDPAGKKVVLAIHGWIGSELAQTAEMLDGQLDDSWTVGTFSYPELNSQWPAKSGAAECLRQAIHEAHDKTGSDSANVYLVTHSMGGILARFGINLLADPGIADLVGGLVTLDTPHKGSPLGATVVARLLQGKDGDGATCLALHHPRDLPAGCDYPPYIPPEIPITQVVGDVTIKRTFFSFGFGNLDTNTDGVVWKDSQSGYTSSSAGPTPTNTVRTTIVACETGLGTLAAQWGGALVNPNLLSVFGITGSKQLAAGDPLINTNTTALAIIGQISKYSACGHSLMVVNPDAISKIAYALNQMPAREAAAAPSGGWVIDGTGVGPVKLGGNLDDVRNDPALKVTAMEPYCGRLEADGWSLTLIPTENGGEIVSGVVMHKGQDTPSDAQPKTEAGIGLGSSEDDLLSAYPEAVPVAEGRTTHAETSEYSDYRVDFDGTPIAFGTEDGVVDFIGVTFVNVPWEICG